MHERLRLLLQVQEQDRAIAELKGRLRRLVTRRAELEKQIIERRQALARMKEGLEGLRRESRRRNDEVDSLDYQIKSYQQQLDRSILSYREMEALKEKIELTKRRMEELADGAIALMGEVEAKEEELAREAATLEEWEGVVRREIEQIERESSARQAELEGAERRRAELARGAERHLIEQYERLRVDYGYEDPIVKVEGDSCSGCKMRLSQNTLERVQEGRELAICENCRRILYRD
ncbi:MAG: zinc ribbon domain-containing protein [Candidatus Bipolaricaulia bacterium]